MDICGEHGEEIAFIGRDCPACAQLDDIRSDHEEVVGDMQSDFQADINNMQDAIDDLQTELDTHECS